jgi:hypothetical protein
VLEDDDQRLFSFDVAEFETGTVRSDIDEDTPHAGSSAIGGCSCRSRLFRGRR